ncbi:MAG: AI-2E family transporter [Candidatus Paceibacterota bacterium]|jgi:predicted PurR-regulated permease PerM
MITRSSQTHALVALTVAVALLAMLMLWPYFTALALALVLAIVFWPVYRVVLRTLRYSGVAAFATTVVVICVVLIPLSFFGFLIFREAANLYQSFGAGSGGDVLALLKINIDHILGQLFPGSGITIDVSGYFQQFAGWIAQMFGGLFTSALVSIMMAIFAVFSLFYFFKDGENIAKVLTAYSPLSDQDDARIFERIRHSISMTFRGSVIIALIQGVVSGVGFWIFGVPNPALWGGVAAVAALVPNLGTSLVLIPAIVYLAFMSASLVPAAGLALWGVIAVGLIDNFLASQLIGRGVQMHPLLVVLGVLGGVGMFGPVGFLIGPTLLAVLVTLFEMYQVVAQKQKIS